MKNFANLRVLSAIAIVGAASFAGAGCVVRARASASGEAVAAPVTYTSRPTLVAVGSGVWVVRGSAQATYYVDGSYWVYRDAVWYRSSSYAGGWVVVQVNVVPTVIVSRKHETYVYYQGDAKAATKPAPGDEVASNDPPPKKDKDELPGVGNKRKEAGEQPGEVGKGLLKDSPKDAPKGAAKAAPKDSPKDSPKAAPPASEASPKADAKDEKKPAKEEKKGDKKKN